jgi:hypothetical protein
MDIHNTHALFVRGRPKDKDTKKSSRGGGGI